MIQKRSRERSRANECVCIKYMLMLDSWSLKTGIFTRERKCGLLCICLSPARSKYKFSKEIINTSVEGGIHKSNLFRIIWQKKNKQKHPTVLQKMHLRDLFSFFSLLVASWMLKTSWVCQENVIRLYSPL